MQNKIRPITIPAIFETLRLSKHCRKISEKMVELFILENVWPIARKPLTEKPKEPICPLKEERGTGLGGQRIYYCPKKDTVIGEGARMCWFCPEPGMKCRICGKRGKFTFIGVLCNDCYKKVSR